MMHLETKITGICVWNTAKDVQAAENAFAVLLKVSHGDAICSFQSGFEPASMCILPSLELHITMLTLTERSNLSGVSGLTSYMICCTLHRPALLCALSSRCLL